MSSANPSALADSEVHTLVDVAFPLRGRVVPRDHGYLLYGAICRLLPQAHEGGWLAVHPLPGRIADQLLILSPRPLLTLRVAAKDISRLLPLAGAKLRLGDHEIAVGTPNLFAVRPSSDLVSRQVVIRLTQTSRKGDGTLDKEAMARSYLLEIQRQLHELGVSAEAELGPPRQITVQGRRVLGFTVRLHGLTPEDSLRVQAFGIGGKRAMGCGVFGPSRQKKTSGGS
jgi:CRISPR-associated protein Cas6